MEFALLNRQDLRFADLDYSLVIEPEEIDDLNGDCRLKFAYPLNEPESQYLKRGNKVAVTNIMGDWQLYTILSDEIIIDGRRQVVMVEAFGDWYELENKEFRKVTQASAAPSLAIQAALEDTGWQEGTVEISTSRTLDTGVLVSPLEALRRIARLWEGELRFRVTISGSGITGKYVDLLTRRGAERGKAFELGYDMEGVEITTILDETFTAMYGWGIGADIDEDSGETERIDFSSVEWVKDEPAELYPDGPTSPAPVDKPAGQKWVGDEDARLEYGSWNAEDSAFNHRFGQYDSQAQYPESLLWETWRQLQRRKVPIINIRASVKALQNLEGFSHERVDLGDTNYVILEDFVEPLEARVIKISRRRKDPASTIIELGNFRPAASNQLANLQTHLSRLESRTGVWDKIIDIDPAHEVDTSRLEGVIDAAENQIKIGGGTVWADGDGFWIFDGETTPENATAAIRGVAFEGEAILAVGKRDTPLDEWEWRVGMGSDGFRVFGEEIVSGIIYTEQVRIQGDTYFYWDDKNLHVIDPDNINKQIRLGKYDGTNYGLAFTKDGGTTWHGVLDHDGLRIGSSSQFDEGYDPSDKVDEDDLGDLAFENIVETAHLGETVIVGGYIKTELINASAIAIGDLDGAGELAEKNEDYLGALALLNEVGVDQLGATVIVDGFIKTDLINASAIAIGDLSGAGELAEENKDYLGALALLNEVGIDELGSTVIVGGYIKTDLINTGAIHIGEFNGAGELAEEDKDYLGALALLNEVGIDEIGTTVIVGGYIKTELINASAIHISNFDGAGDLASQNESDLGLKDMAYEDMVEFAKLGETIIQGGYIKTELLTADRIVVGTLIDDVIDSADDWHAKETPEGAQSKADTAEDNAKDYTDTHEDKDAPHSGHETPDGAQAKADGAVTTSNNYTDSKIDLLGDMAYENMVEEAKLGATIIEGGYIKGSLLNVRSALIGSFDNLIHNPGFEASTTDLTGWTALGGKTEGWGNLNIPRSGARCARFNANGLTSPANLMSTAYAGANDGFGVHMGQQIYAEVWTRGSGVTYKARIIIQLRSRTDDVVQNILGPWVERSATSYAKTAVAGEVTASGAAYGYVVLQVSDDSYTAGNNFIRFDDVYCRFMNEGFLTVDGAITAQKLDVNDLTSITAEFSELKAGTLPSGARLEMGDSSGPYLDMYDSTRKRVELNSTSLKFIDSGGNEGGFIDADHSWAGVSTRLLTIRSPRAVAVTSYATSSRWAALWLSTHGSTDRTATLYSDGVDGLNFVSCYKDGIQIQSAEKTILIQSDGSVVRIRGDANTATAINIQHGTVDMINSHRSGSTYTLQIPRNCNVGQNMIVVGNFDVYGNKSAVVDTETYGKRKLYSVEAPDSRFQDLIQKHFTKPGQYWVELNEMFAETIEPDYAIFTSIDGDGYVKIMSREPDRFLVDYSGEDGRCSFLIYGVRKDKADIYMEEVH